MIELVRTGIGTDDKDKSNLFSLKKRSVQ